MYKCICITAVIAETVPCALGSAVSALHCLHTPMYNTPMAADSDKYLEAQIALGEEIRCHQWHIKADKSLHKNLNDEGRTRSSSSTASWEKLITERIAY